MPGLNQLKNFVNNLQSLGNEASVRAERGETLRTLPFPENAVEADDSEDFLYGLPVNEEDTSSEETSSKETPVADSSVPTTDEGEIDIDALLNTNIDGSVDENNAAQEPPAQEEVSAETPSETPDLPDFGDLPDVNEEPVVESFDTPASSETQISDDFEMPSFDSMDSDDNSASADNDTTATADDAVSNDFEMPDFGGSDSNSASFEPGDTDFDLPDFDFDEPSSASEKPLDTGIADSAGTEPAAVSDDFDMPDFDTDFSVDEKPAETTATEPAAQESSLPDFSMDTDSLDLPDFDIDDQVNSTKGFDETPSVNMNLDEKADFDMPDFADSSTDNAVVSETGETSSSEDTQNDFSIEGLDTDNSEDDSTADDFSIPGFSDITEPAEITKKKSAASDIEEDVGDGQFSNAEYQKFIENLNYYPLNLRVEIEKLLVEDQFNEEENIKLVRMVIKKTPVRQLANHVGKMIDKVIEVPRNYDKRTAAQYEAYKQTTEYQLKNRIIPFVSVCIVILVLAASTLFLGKTFVYDPVRAELLYKEGYTLLEGEYYPLSEEKFIEATEFKKKKDWFFKYARGYREKRQYERASQMYKWIIRCFPKDKRGGLEYAEMKLYDEMKYSEAEEIVRRQVLDSFINDPDGMLLLGDIYLEWACNEDASKFELARAQYETVLDLYGQSDRYLAKMLRYYIRTDNLREVLPLKNYFYPDKKTGPKKIKALSAPDILDLSCYLLDKLYGELTPAEEYLRSYIEDVRALLERAIVADPSVPEAYYNYARYFIYTADVSKAQVQLEYALDVFAKAKPKTKSRILKNIDTYRLLGELYTDQQEYLKSEELYVKGISLFESEKDASNLKAGKEIGLLYADMADLDYFISGDNDNALRNYLHAVEYDNDTSSIRYRIGYIQYGKKNYLEALGAFIASSEENGNDLHLLLSLANTLSMRDDNFAAQGYYQRFIDEFAKIKAQKGILFPQIQSEDADLVDNYMKATNNFGVTLGKLSFRTGDSNQNALAMVYMAESMRAWDALTRNQETMIRLDGSNLAAQNMQYLRYPVSPFEPALYFDIPRTLQDEKVLTQPTLKIQSK